MISNKFLHSLGNIKDKILAFMDTPWFGATLAAIELFSYYLSLDLLIILTVSFFLTFSLAFKKNLNCILVLFLFLSSMISYKNSPANIYLDGNSGYFYKSYVLILCIIAAGFPIFFVVFRAIRNLQSKLIPMNLMIVSSVILSLSFLTNGLFAANYDWHNIMYGFFMLFFFLILFIALLPNVSINKEKMLLLSRQVAFYSLVPLIELIVYYWAFFYNGYAIDDRLFIFLGWGNRNTIGMVLCITICFLICLLRYEKNIKTKIAVLFLAIVNCVGIVMSFSRQAYLAAALVICFYLIFSIIKSEGKERKKLIVYLVSCCTLGIITLVLFIFTGLLNIELLKPENSNELLDGRLSLWKSALSSFAKYPVFGDGFFFLGGDHKVALEEIVPLCCHNTLLEMMGACGIFGLLAYLFYRFTTVKEIIKKMIEPKSYPLMALSMFLFMSLLDIHIFNLLGTCVYVALLVLSMCNNNVEEKIEREEKVEEKPLVLE